MASQVSYSDLDGDFKPEAVFFSKSQQGQSASLILRIARGNDFRELSNLRGVRHAPSLGVKMLLVDVDARNGTKELVYLTSDRSRLVAMSLQGNGAERFNFQLPTRLSSTAPMALVERNQGNGKVILIGNNILRLDPQTGPRMESAYARVDGGWSPFNDWGVRCSKSCGDGQRTQIRLCTSPEPRNGGAYCQGSGVRTQSCRVRACTAQDCQAGEKLESGNCVVDSSSSNPNPNPNPTDGGGGTPSDPGGPQCAQGLIWDDFRRQCYVPHSIDDIWLEYEIRSGGGREEEPTFTNYVLRLSLTHEKASGLNAEQTANRYCAYRGFDGAISHRTETYRAGYGTNSLRAFVTCDILSNGLFEGRGGCPIGNGRGVSYTMNNIYHNQDQEVRFLKSVVCRKDNEATMPLVQ